MNECIYYCRDVRTSNIVVQEVETNSYKRHSPTVRPRFKATLQICNTLELQQFSDL